MYPHKVEYDDGDAKEPWGEVYAAVINESHLYPRLFTVSAEWKTSELVCNWTFPNLVSERIWQSESTTD